MTPSTQTLLLVDDEEANRLILGRRLQQEGYAVTTAANGREALALLQGRRFDLVLLDLYMPEMDGMAMLAALKADDALRDIPVIMLTADSNADQVRLCLDRGAADYLVKPVAQEELRRRIGRCLGADAAAGDAQQASPPSDPTAATDCPDGPVVDWDALAGRFPDRREFIRRLVVAVLTSHADAPASLRAAATAADWERLAQQAHALKGMGGNMMAARVHELGGRTELAARQGQPDAAQLAEQLAQAMEALLAAMNAWLAEDAAP